MFRFIKSDCNDEQNIMKKGRLISEFTATVIAFVLLSRALFCCADTLENVTSKF